MPTPAATPTMSPADLARRAAMAREAGFPSYEAMVLFNSQRERRRTSQTTGSQNLNNAPPPRAAPPPQDVGAFERIRQALMGARN